MHRPKIIVNGLLLMSVDSALELIPFVLILEAHVRLPGKKLLSSIGTFKLSLCDESRFEILEERRLDSVAF